MKYAVLICLCMHLGIFTAVGQNHPSSFGERFAIKGGASLSITQNSGWIFSDSRDLKNQSILSPYLYIEYAQPFGKHDMVFGVQVIQKGFSSDNRFSTGNKFTYRYLLNYIELPLQFRLNLNKCSFSGGLYVSYLYDDTYQFNFDDFSRSIQYPHPDRYKSYDYGFTLGFSKPITSFLIMDVNYQKGLVNIDNWNSQDLRYHTSLMIGLRYQFLSSR